MDVKARGNVLGSFIPARYIVSILGSIGISIVYGLKVNLPMAMVGMLNHTALKLNNSEDVNLMNASDAATSESNDHDGPFVWASDVQGTILSCYYWGYFVSQIPGGRAAEMFSVKWAILFCVTNNAVCTMLSPVIAKTHYIALMCIRILEGISAGVVFPAMNVLLSKWAPPAEQGVMAALTFSGTSHSNIHVTDWNTDSQNWESSFYVLGGLSTIWCVLWAVLIQDTPQKQPFISVQERHMIVMSLGGKGANHTDHKKLPVPWRAVFTSPAFLAILIAHTCSNCGWYMLLTELPFYIKQVLHFNLTENTLSAALPYFSQYIFTISLGRTLDWLRNMRIITMTTAKKIGSLFGVVVPAISLLILSFIGTNRGAAVATMAVAITCTGVVVPAISLLILSFIGTNRGAAVATMAVAITCTGGMYCGFATNHMDIASNYAGTLFAITNTVATIPGIIVPIFVSAVTRDNQTIQAWRIVFYVTVGIYAVAIITYLVFGSGEEQPWNKPNKATIDEVEKMPLNDEKKTVV